jgi:hypothetical protein
MSKRGRIKSCLPFIVAGTGGLGVVGSWPLVFGLRWVRFCKFDVLDLHPDASADSCVSRSVVLNRLRSLVLYSPAVQNDVDFSRCVMAASCKFRFGGPGIRGS